MLYIPQYQRISHLECQITYIIVIGSQPTRLLVLPLCVLYYDKNVYMSTMYSIWRNKNTYLLLSCVHEQQCPVLISTTSNSLNIRNWFWDINTPDPDIHRV